MKTNRSVIKVSNLFKSYGDVRAVEGISFEVGQGEVFGLLGPNGAGKTTTLNVLEGLLQADAGIVQILGYDVVMDGTKIKKKIGVQLQKTSLLPDMKVIEQIMLFSRLYGHPISRKQGEVQLEKVGLKNKVDFFPKQFSGGQQQRLALALALVNNPEIVFLDEPTTGLDPQSRRRFWEIIRNLKEKGVTVILTTHYMEEAEALCQRVGIIDHGKIIALGTPENLIGQLEAHSTITIAAPLPLEEIRRFPNVIQADHNNEILRLQTSDIMATLSRLLESSIQFSVSFQDIHISQPTLEDVFLQLTGRMIRDT